MTDEYDLKCKCGNLVYILEDGTSYHRCKDCLEKEIKKIKTPAYCYNCYEKKSPTFLVRGTIHICDCVDREWLYCIIEDDALAKEYLDDWKIEKKEIQKRKYRLRKSKFRNDAQASVKRVFEVAP